MYGKIIRTRQRKRYGYYGGGVYIDANELYLK